MGLVIAVAAVASICFSDEPPQISCRGTGKVFSCVGLNIEQYTLLPKWVYHTSPVYSEYGEGFGAKAVKSWTLLEMRVYPDDQSVAPYNGTVYRPTYVLVKLCNGRAVFAAFVPGVDPPDCPPKGGNK